MHRAGSVSRRCVCGVQSVRLSFTEDVRLRRMFEHVKKKFIPEPTPLLCSNMGRFVAASLLLPSQPRLLPLIFDSLPTPLRVFFCCGRLVYRLPRRRLGALGGIRIHVAALVEGAHVKSDSLDAVP